MAQQNLYFNGANIAPESSGPENYNNVMSLFDDMKMNTSL